MHSHYSLSAVRRGTNSIAPMTAAAVVRYLPCSKCLGCAFALRSPLRTRQEIHRLLPTERCTRIKRLRQSGFVANGTRRLTFFASPSTADNGTAVRAVIGRVRNRILRQIPDLYASATPHSLRSYGICSNSAAAQRYRFATHSFNGWRCCPIPPLFKVLLGKDFSLRSPLRAG